MARTKSGSQLSIPQLRNQQQLLQEAIRNLERVSRFLPHNSSLPGFVRELKAAKKNVDSAVRTSQPAGDN